MGDMNAQTADVSKVTYATLHINTYLTGDTKRVMPDLLLLTKIILKRKIYLSKHCKIYYRLHNIYLQTNLSHPRKYLRPVSGMLCSYLLSYPNVTKKKHHLEVIYLKTLEC